MTIEQIASAVFNDVTSGLAGVHENPAMDMEQLEDEVVSMREAIVLD